MGANYNTEILFDNYLKTAENITTYFDDKEKRNNVLKDLEEIVKENCMYNIKSKKVTDIFKELSNSVENNNPQEIMKLFKKEKETLLNYAPDVSNHPNLNEFCSQVKQLVDHADGVTNTKIDDDIEMTQDDVNVIDPFTKIRMTDPVKNKICGHVYDRASVTSLVSRNKNTRCPVIGCINKDPLQIENLVPDIITRKYLNSNPA